MLLRLISLSKVVDVTLNLFSLDKKAGLLRSHFLLLLNIKIGHLHYDVTLLVTSTRILFCFSFHS